MYLLKLFHQSDPVHPVDARMMSEGVTRVGRDPGCDWFVPDEECEISRAHLEVQLRAGRLLVKPLGANGVYCGSSADRLTDGEAVPATVGDRFRFGKYSILVETSRLSEEAGTARTMILAAPLGENTTIPTEWADADAALVQPGEGSLLEAFCEGARLDASAFSTEDPADVMRQAGAVYRQMVLGLATLMSERSSVKTRYRMDRTTIAAQDNNPFKWAPTQRLAIDLLLKKDCGFLSGAAAIKASFQDLQKHMLSTLAGFRASLQALLDGTRPASVEDRAQKSGLFQSREAACWDAFRTVHLDLERQVTEDEDGALNHAFIRAYDTRMRELDKDDGP